MKIEEFDDFIVFELGSKQELLQLKLENLNKPYTVRLVECKEDGGYRTIFNYGINGEFKDKLLFVEDQDGHEVQCIEYDNEDNIVRQVVFENYPNGETKWRYEYDREGRLINKEFFDEDQS